MMSSFCDCSSKMKKQEITRISEGKRRNRLKTQLNHLQFLLFKEEPTTKLTRESILDKAIKVATDHYL